MREIYTKKEEKDWLSLKKAKKIIFLFIDIRKSLSMISTKDFFFFAYSSEKDCNERNVLINYYSALNLNEHIYTNICSNKMK